MVFGYWFVWSTCTEKYYFHIPFKMLLVCVWGIYRISLFILLCQTHTQSEKLIHHVMVFNSSDSYKYIQYKSRVEYTVFHKEISVEWGGCTLSQVVYKMNIILRTCRYNLFYYEVLCDWVIWFSLWIGKSFLTYTPSWCRSLKYSGLMFTEYWNEWIQTFRKLIIWRQSFRFIDSSLRFFMMQPNFQNRTLDMFLLFLNQKLYFYTSPIQLNKHIKILVNETGVCFILIVKKMFE